METRSDVVRHRAAGPALARRRPAHRLDLCPVGLPLLALAQPPGPPDPATITYRVPWDIWTGDLDLWQHHRGSYSGDPIWIYVAVYFGPPFLLAILAVWNLVRGRRASIALRRALIITGILGLLWTGVMWIVSIGILVTSKTATSYGPAVAAAGFLYAVLAGVFGWVSRPAKPSSASAASAASAARPPLAEERQRRPMWVRRSFPDSERLADSP